LLFSYMRVLPQNYSHKTWIFKYEPPKTKEKDGAEAHMNLEFKLFGAICPSF